MVLDISRCAVHDGPGIRTTVFLKGCPLHCAWCHNPESIRKRPGLAFFADRCNYCSACAEVCPKGVHQVTGERHSIDRSECTLCGKCVEACMTNALQIVGSEMTVDEVMQVVVKDKAYYKTSGGGVTFSGGEPTQQPKFLEQLLKAAKKEGIHTCVDTCGYVNRKVLEELLPLTDLFMFDYKLPDNDLYLKYTGVSNEPVMKNLDFLYQNKAGIILRCPVIPGINDTEEHFNSIIALEQKYPDIKEIMIMPYHNTGNAKYTRYGLKNPLPDLPSAEEKDKKQWAAFFERAGGAWIFRSILTPQDTDKKS